MQEHQRQSDPAPATLSRRALARAGVAATLATAGVVGTASAARAAFVEYGEVYIREPQVVTRERDGELELVYIPDDRYVVLDESGRQLWEALAGGVNSMSRLVADHAAATGLSEGVAAYQVISFFDELRAQGYVSFALEGERERPPLLDAPLELLDGQAQKVLTLDLPDPGLTVTQLHEMARQATGLESMQVERALFAATDKPGVSVADLDALLSDHDSRDVRRLGAIDLPGPESTLGDLVSEVTTSARIVVVVVVVIGDWIIIVVVVIDGGGGPSAGKSRSACKTMCV
jgi:Coenzyme PQQ synthesis protein D (PqqD)